MADEGRVTQLVVETLHTVPASPLAVTQVVAEHLDINANEARVTLVCCELIIIPAAPHVVCPTAFPTD